MDEIIIVEYDPRWSQQFEEEATTIWQVLGNDLVTRIEHFGSTAVPGLAAKPIIDLLVEVRSLKEAKKSHTLLEALGYAYWQEDPRPGQMFLVKGMPPYGLQRTHHLHLVEADSDLWERLLFRDYLRSHPEEAQHYAALKRQLAERFKTNREAYTNAKTDYIQAVMAKARRHNHKNQ
ncbi:GrpB family protein [Gloeocapsopsis crepidinum LEGE 06123]|uniref:GrpB family protein n=1 Tax=Gloeocapsopsis crepidinum LEGE 06123 TaxID=588587 RepID=A0ABR9UPG2_9CHRO|nr:GrpB family protein [Gloeocapsopsis crepidinum]MBE9190164.1 GrpB family protein [Gloeocapsopsis crepidinum LEGE 06123]